MNDRVHARLTEYGRFLRLSFVLAAPGLTPAGFFLAGGDWTKCPPYAFVSLAGAALFASIFAETGFPAAETEGISRSTKTTVRAASFLLTMLFSSFRPETFTAAMLILLTALAAPKIASVTFLGAACTALRFVFLTALGMTLVPLTGMKSFLPYADVFAAGIFFYIYGLEEARGLKSLRPAVRPGGLPLLLGAGVCYLTVFFRLGRMEFHGFTSYFCGVLAAVSAGLFFIFAWKAWRVFRQKSLPGIAKRWTDGLRLGLFFIEAAVAAAAGLWSVTLFLLAAAAAARFLHSYLESEAENGV